MTGNPVAVVPIPKGTGAEDGAEVFPYDIPTLRAVVEELTSRSPRQGQLALVMGLTGLRWGEVVALRVRDLIEVPRPTLRISRSAPDGFEPRNRTKGGKARSVPLADELIPIVESWAADKEPDDLLFTTDRGALDYTNPTGGARSGGATLAEGGACMTFAIQPQLFGSALALT